MKYSTSTNPRDPLNIIIADDHLLILDLIKQVVKDEINDSIITTATDYSELVNALNANCVYDLILMDYRMPGVNGMVGIKWILSNFSQPSLIVMSGLANSSEVTEFMNLGVKGYVPKTSSTSTLVCAIKLVLEGEKYVPSSQYEQQELMTAPKITPRELDVLKKLHVGYPNKQIAQSLSLEEVTIKMYISRLCKKLNVKNRTHLVIEAINHGLI